LKTVLTTLNAKYIHSSLALRYLKAYCRPICDIKIKEFSINNGLLDVLSDIYAEKPEVLGLACYIWNIEMTLQLTTLIKKVLPNTIIILGGPEVSYDAQEIMKKQPEIDYIVQGEGEETFFQLLSTIQEKSSGAISNAISRVGNEIIAKAGTGVVENLDTIPFPYHDEDIIELKDKIIYYESSRGCPFSCQYCLSSVTKGVRFLSLERVFSDLSFFIKHNVRQVKFVDRTFNARKAHYLPLLKFIAEQDCQTNFHFEIAADILDDEVLALLQYMPRGRVQFEIGVQSTNMSTLEQIQRSNNWPIIVKNVKQILSYRNIHVHLDLIVGLPEESYERFGQSFNDVYSLKPHMLQIGFLKLLKGSGIRQRVQEHQYIYMESAPYQVLGNKYLSYGEIRKLHLLEEVFNQIYNSSKFDKALSYFIKLHGGDAFKFYDDLTEYWEARELHVVAHSSKSLYKYMLEFCQAHYPADSAACEELLRFDVLVGEKGTLKPDFLNWNEMKWNEKTTEFWRNEKLVRKYIPDFKFTTWRDLKKKYHIEVFSFDLPGFIATGEFLTTHKITPILFSFGAEYTTCKTIDMSDFGMENEDAAL